MKLLLLSALLVITAAAAPISMPPTDSAVLRRQKYHKVAGTVVESIGNVDGSDSFISAEALDRFVSAKIA